MNVALLLHDVRSAHNVGSIFRTADAVGVSRIYLSGYTPSPIDRFGRAQKEIAKTALGAEKSITYESVPTPGRLITRLKKEGWTVVGIEQDPRAIDYRSYTPREKTLFVLGNEVDGIPASIRKKCDVLIEIEMSGTKESLNVAVAAGVALFRVLDR